MITATVIVKNGQRKLRDVLQALQGFNEVLIFDSGSTDQTLKIAKTFSNVSIYQRPFEGFGPAHNQAAELAKNDWILSIDADEVISEALAEEILNLKLDPKNVYSLPFHNYFNGKWIKWCGWYPEKHIRLYNRKSTQFSQAMVHEGVESKGVVVQLKNPVKHYSYETISDFLNKMERYSTLFAKQYEGKKKSSPLIASYHGVGAFLKSFFIKRGFMGGFEGLLISLYNGQTAFYKYLKLYERNL